MNTRAYTQRLKPLLYTSVHTFETSMHTQQHKHHHPFTFVHMPKRNIE